MLKQQFVVVLLAVSHAASAQQVSLSYSNIASRLYDFKALASPPLVGEKCGNWTSHSRACTYDPVTDTYQQWYDNADGNGYITNDGNNYVVAEMNGPGVIWRVWSALPEQGPISVYIDGNTNPVLSIPFTNYFNNATAPFNYPELVRNNASGLNNYVPIPYEQSCKVVLGPGWGAYYHITYSTFPTNVTVPSFTGSFTADQQVALQQADTIWAARRGSGDTEPFNFSTNVTIAPGGEVEVFNTNQPGVISALTVDYFENYTVTNPLATSGSSVDTLREITLSMYWDGETNPSVWVPLGDFFGTAPGVNTYQSLAAGMTGDSFYSNWYMPYNTARIVLKNEGSSSHTFTFNFCVDDEPAAAQLLRFHSKWHRDNFGDRNPSRYMADRWPDWPVLLVTNTQGRFCGFNLHLWNPVVFWDPAIRQNYVFVPPMTNALSPGMPTRSWFLNNVILDHYWWGEGDERFFVDGEKFPSSYGTGTEDYFGYAWGQAKKFDSAVECQPLNFGGNYGHVSLNRWLICDNIPFQDSIEACIEKYHWEEWPLQYAVTAVWYQQPGTTDEYSSVAVTNREGYYNFPSPRNYGVYEPEDGAFDVSTSAGYYLYQDMWVFGQNVWSGNAQLLWNPTGVVGSSLTMTFNVGAAGLYTVSIPYTQAEDYGIFGVVLDDTVLENYLELYGPQVTRLGPISYGQLYLNAGTHKLSVSYLGSDSLSQGSLFGIDCLILEPVTRATTTDLESSLNPSGTGQFVTLTATVSTNGVMAGDAGGTMVFMDGGSALSTNAVTNGTAVFTTSALSYGSHLLTGEYTGDTFHVASTSAPLAQVVLATMQSTTVLEGSPNPSLVGSNVNLTATVEVGGSMAGGAGGTMVFLDGWSPLSTNAVTEGTAVFTTSALSNGSHLLAAQYSGGSYFTNIYLASTSAPLAQVVLTPIQSTTVLEASPNPSLAGSNVNLTATVEVGGVTAGDAVGTMVFLDGGSPLSTNAVTEGTAGFATSALSCGSHLLTAQYSGGWSYLASTSAPVTQLVQLPLPQLSVFVSWSSSGASLTLSWPNSFQGWILQVQTNALAAGTNWVDIAGTEYLTSTNLTLNPGNPVEFYRLRCP
jgi:hypothetical protein